MTSRNETATNRKETAMKTTSRTICLAFLACAIFPSIATADVKATAARELADYVIEKLGIKGGQEAATELAARFEAAGAKYGEEAVDQAVRKVGPRAIALAEGAGENGPRVMKLISRFGDDGVWIASQPERLSLFAKYGEPAAEAMIRHEGIAEPVIEAFGKPAADALVELGPQSGRRLAIMAQEGELAGLGRTDALLGVVGKYGDSAMNFIWRNKGALAVGVAMTAFLADPKPFIDGTKDIGRIAAENIGKPLANVPGAIASEAAKKADWTLVLIVVAVLTTALLAFRFSRKARLARAVERR
jgi:hypothetical protein